MIRTAIVKLLTELTDQLREARETRIKRRMFGLHGEAAYSALWQIRQGLRSLNKYGASEQLGVRTDKRGRVSSRLLYSAVYGVIEEQCPNMEEVWG